MARFAHFLSRQSAHGITSRSLDSKSAQSLASCFHSRAPGHGMAAGLPRPEPSPAGKLVSHMGRDRGFALLLRLLVTLVFAAALALAVASVSSTRAWARTAPLIVASGDPTGGEDSPRTGPKNAATLGMGSQGTLVSGTTLSRRYAIWHWLNHVTGLIRTRYLL